MEHLAPVIGRALGLDPPDVVLAQNTPDVETRYDVGGELREVELSQPFLGVQPHPAADRHVVPDNLEIAQLRWVSGPRPQVELHGGYAAWRLPPDDAVENHVSAGQVRPDMDQMLLLRALRNRDLDRHLSIDEVTGVEIELVAIGPIKRGSEAQRGLLLRRSAEDVLPSQLDRHTGDQKVPTGIDGLVRYIESHRSRLCSMLADQL